MRPGDGGTLLEPGVRIRPQLSSVVVRPSGVTGQPRGLVTVPGQSEAITRSARM